MSTERRRQMLHVLKDSGAVIPGKKLAEAFNVSRQVIVQDIAILRAQGEDIIATARGYTCGKEEKSPVIRKRIACCHDANNMRNELLAIVDAGCCVRDVIVEHSLYGELQGLLLLENKKDVEDFVDRYEQQGAELLSALTAGVHLHTIEAKNPRAFKKAESNLRKLDILLEDNKQSSN